MTGIVLNSQDLQTLVARRITVYCRGPARLQEAELTCDARRKMPVHSPARRRRDGRLD